MEEGGGGEGGGGARDTESKTRTPHKDVGEKKEYQWNPEKLIISCVENLQFLEVRLQLCHISPGSPFYSQEHQLGPRGSTRKIVHHILSAWGGGGWYIQDVPSRSYGEQGEIWNYTTVDSKQLEPITVYCLGKNQPRKRRG